MSKRIFTYIFTFIFCSMQLGFQSKAKTLDESLYDIAVRFYESHIGTTDFTYEKGLTIGRVVDFENWQGTITAHMYIYKNCNNESEGYVVVSTSGLEEPIIEFAFWGDNFVESFEKKAELSKEEVKYYYLGGYQYVAEVVENEPIYYNLLNGKQLENPRMVDTIENNMPEVLSTYSIYELSQATVTGYNQSYYITSYFNDANNCGPTAGVNLCVYYYSQGKTAIRSNSWDNTYDLIYDYMRTTSTNGTYARYMKSGMVDYIVSCGYGCTGEDEVNDPIGRAKGEVDNGRPSLIAIEGDSTYGNHVVLSLGYKVENGIIYLLVADGWHSTANRYIYNNGGTVRDCISFIIN